MKYRKTKNSSFVFNKAKFLKQCLIGDDICTGQNFLHMIGTSDGHQKFHLSSDQGFSEIRIIFVRISHLVSELPMSIGIFVLLLTEGSQETISEQTGLTKRSAPEHSKWELSSWIVIWKIIAHKAHVWVQISDSKCCKHNFNTCILFVCFDKICKWASSYFLLNKVPPS